MRTIESEAARASTDCLPLIGPACGQSRVCTAAQVQRLGLELWVDLVAARGGARIACSGASSRMIAMGRPQWRHTKVGGFAAGSSLAAVAPSLTGMTSTGAARSCRAAANYLDLTRSVYRESGLVRWPICDFAAEAGCLHGSVTSTECESRSASSRKRRSATVAMPASTR